MGGTMLFSPSNPHMPVQLFLSIIEHEGSAKGSQQHSDLINLAMSSIDISELEGTTPLHSLQQQATWDDFKCEMIKWFALEDSLRNNMELMKSVVTDNKEALSHVLIRARFVAEKMARIGPEDCARILFLLGLSDMEADLCLDRSDLGRVSDLEAWVELLSSLAKSEPNGANASKEINLKNEVGNADEEDSVKSQELGNNSNGNPHKRPVLAPEQLILEAILSSHEPKLSMHEILCSIGQRYPFYRHDNSNWVKNIQKSLNTSSNDIFNGEMEQGDKKWSLRVGVESVLLKKLKWSNKNESDKKLLKMFKMFSRNGDSSFDNYFSQVSKLGLTKNKSFEVIKLLCRFWSKNPSYVDNILASEHNDGFIPVQAAPIKLTYSELICDTFEKSSVKALTADEICLIISKNHPTYSMNEKGWQSSVRLNLSINKELFGMVKSEKGDVKWIMSEKAKFQSLDTTVGQKYLAHSLDKSSKSKGTYKECSDDIEVDPLNNTFILSLEPSTSDIRENMFCCDQCDFKTELAVWLKSHKNQKHLCETETFKCEEPKCFYETCGSKRKVEAQRIRHLAHPHYSKEKDGYYHCPENDCNKKTLTKFLLARHIKSHKNTHNLVCHICAMVVTSKQILKNHIATQHGGEARFVCKFEGCTFKTNNVSGFKKHVQGVHDKIRNLSCHKCPYRTDNTGNLMRHMNSHVEDSERIFYGCVICDVTKTQKGNLRHHMKKKHHLPLTDFRTLKGAKQLKVFPYIPQDKNGLALKMFSCPKCKNTFTTKQGLNKHIEAMHMKSLEERKVHSCSQCTQKFATPIHLRSHIKIVHLQVREYRCKICDVRFSNVSNLKEHIGIKHLGYKDSKEWRKPENKNVRKNIPKHEAYEYIPFKGPVI